MKNIYSSLSLAIIITVSGCKKDAPAIKLRSCNYSGTVVDSQAGNNARIYKVAEFWVVDLAKNGGIIRCAPCNLPDELKIENKSIRIDANFHPIPPNAFMVGQPIEITKIY